MSSQELNLAALDLDRAVHRRSDTLWLRTQLLTSARLIYVWRGLNLFELAERKKPLFLSSATLSDLSEPIFLGICQDEIAYFAVNLGEPPTEQDALDAVGLDAKQARFIHLRSFDGSLFADERALLFYARVLANWRSEQKFCNRCGSPTYPEEAGHLMACSNKGCAAKHFPRSDPATIMLVHDGDNCLLGRQPSWPEGIYSTLAGFVEAGESVEEAVRREVKEESGIVVTNVRYFGSQPWPFPQSLMLGYFAQAVTREIVRGPELADARWFDIGETREILKRLSTRFPHLDTIARRLIRTWLETKSEVPNVLGPTEERKE
jgi:NAD+ diphosphatase